MTGIEIKAEDSLVSKYDHYGLSLRIDFHLLQDLASNLRKMEEFARTVLVGASLFLSHAGIVFASLEPVGSNR